MIKKRFYALTTWLVIIAMISPVLLTGCGGRAGNDSTPPPVDDTRGGSVTPSSAPSNAPQQHTGLSTKQKVVMLAGAAALYYMYKKHRDAQNQTANLQYYLSKNGRVYYRDEQHRAHWVTPPTQGIQVPENEAQDYKEFQGYNNQKTGRDLVGLGSD